MPMELIVRLRAQADLYDAADFMLREKRVESALRFTDAVQETFELLAQMPAVGSPRPDYAPEIPELRQWRISGFEDYLIFYRPLPKDAGVEILRVLHGKRNIPYLLAAERK
jgi:toxin ParE1/3/4